MVIIVPDARVALSLVILGGREYDAINGYSLMEIIGNGYVSRLEFLAKLIRESGGCLWDLVKNNESMVPRLGDSLRE